MWQQQALARRRYQVVLTGRSRQDRRPRRPSAFSLLVAGLLGLAWAGPASPQTIELEALLVVDAQHLSVYGYDPTGSLVASFALATANSRPSSIAADGVIAYVLDEVGKTIFRYERGFLTAVSAELRRPDGRSLSRPGGLAIDGDEIWVVDRGWAAMFRYSLSGVFSAGRRVSATGEIGLDPGNARAEDLAIDELFLYVVDEIDRQIYVYARSDGQLWIVSPILKQKDGSSLRAPSGVTIEGEWLAIVDRSRDKYLRYRLNDVFSNRERIRAIDEFRLALVSVDPVGIDTALVKPKEQITLVCQGPATFSATGRLQWIVNGELRVDPVLQLDCAGPQRTEMEVRAPAGATGHRVVIGFPRGACSGREYPLQSSTTTCSDGPGQAIFSYQRP